MVRVWSPGSLGRANRTVRHHHHEWCREMATGILRDLPLEILVERFLAADKASAIVLRTEQFDAGRRRLRRRHLQGHRFLVAARGGP